MLSLIAFVIIKGRWKDFFPALFYTLIMTHCQPQFWPIESGSLLSLLPLCLDIICLAAIFKYVRNYCLTSNIFNKNFTVCFS